MTSINITAKEFRDLVSPVLPLASRDGMLPLLNAIKIRSHDGWLTATATDRFRAGVQRHALDGLKAGAFTALVPVADVKRILTIFKPTRRTNPSLTLTVEGETLYVEAADTLGFGFTAARIGFRLLDAEYPDIEAIFTKALAQTSGGSAARFNPHFLSEMARTSAAAEFDVFVGAGRDPALFVSDNFVGILMPRRVGTDFVAPERPTDWGFLSTKPAPAKKAARTRKAKAS